MTAFNQTSWSESPVYTIMQCRKRCRHLQGRLIYILRHSCKNFSLDSLDFVPTNTCILNASKCMALKSWANLLIIWYVCIHTQYIYIYITHIRRQRASFVGSVGSSGTAGSTLEINSVQDIKLWKLVFIWSVYDHF